MYNHLDRILACDGWTDRQTSCHGIVRAMHMHRAVKTAVQQKNNPAASLIISMFMDSGVSESWFFIAITETKQHICFMVNFSNKLQGYCSHVLIISEGFIARSLPNLCP